MHPSECTVHCATVEGLRKPSTHSFRKGNAMSELLSLCECRHDNHLRWFFRGGVIGVNSAICVAEESAMILEWGGRLPYTGASLFPVLQRGLKVLVDLKMPERRKLLTSLRESLKKSKDPEFDTEELHDKKVEFAYELAYSWAVICQIKKVAEFTGENGKIRDGLVALVEQAITSCSNFIEEVRSTREVVIALSSLERGFMTQELLDHLNS